MRSADPVHYTTLSSNPDNPYFGWLLPLAVSGWQQRPKRGLNYLILFLAVLCLWLAPKAVEKRNTNNVLVRHVPSSVALPLAIASAAGAGFLSEKLKEYAAALAGEYEAMEVTALEMDAAQTTVRRTQQKADVAYAQHQIIQALPAEVAAKVEGQPSRNTDRLLRSEADLLADKMAGNLKVKGQDGEPVAAEIANTLNSNNAIKHNDTSITYTSGHTASSGLQIAPEPKTRYRFFTGQIRGKTVRCIDLKSVDSFCGVPVVDLAEDIARDDKTCFLIGVTGAGKSKLCARTIGLSHQYKPLTDGAVITHKSPNDEDGETFDYAGLEDSDEYWIVAGEGENAYEHYQEIERLRSFIGRAVGDLKTGRSSESPALLVIDEYGNGLVAIDIISDGLVAEEEKPVSTKLRALYSNCVRKIITQGNSNKVRGLITSHDSINEELKMSTGEKRNARFVFLGRGGELDSIETVLDPTRKILNKYECRELNELMSRYKAAHRAMGAPENVVLALTNVASTGWRLVIVSQDIDVPRINATATNPPRHATGFTGEGDPQLMPKAEPDSPIKPEVTSLSEGDSDDENSLKPISLEAQRRKLHQLWKIPTSQENRPISPPISTPSASPEETRSTEEIRGDLEEDDQLVGGSAPDWMTKKDFYYLIRKLREKLATPDGLTLSLLQNQLWPYRGDDGLERLKAALNWLEENEVVEVEIEKPFRVYFLGTDHLSP